MSGVPQNIPGRLEAGSQLGHYEILGLLGAGGMGVVYRAVDRRLPRPVAIKVLRPEQVADPERKRRFTREAHAASSLNHPNIVTIYEFGLDQGLDYIVMELVAGKTLRDLIPSKGLEFGACLRCAVQIADGLAAAHMAGIVHRDLKPSNVMVTDKGLVKLLDFGVAKLVEREGGDARETTLTMELPAGDRRVVGTVAYMSPEQVNGLPLDARSDIFTFGVLLYEMVSGRRPFEGSTGIGTLSAIVEKEPVPPRELVANLPREIDRLIRQCLRKQPERRWQHMIDVKQLLEELAHEVEYGESQQEERPPSRRWRYVAALLAGALAGMSGLAVYLWQRSPASVPGAEPVLTMLTTDQGLTAYPAISQDGRLVAYASDRSGEGNLDIWVQQIGGGEALRLTRDPADESDPDFSPDGTRIAFRSEREDGGVYTAPSFGGDAQFIVPRGRNPKYSPDGRTIASWAGMEGSGFLPGAARVMLAPAGGGLLEPLPQRMANAQYPVWSPKGDELLVLGRADPAGQNEMPVDWWIVPRRGGKPRPTGALEKLWGQGLSTPIGQYAFVPLAWLGDNRIVFAATLGDTSNLWQISLSPRTGEAAGPAIRLTAGTGFEVHAACAGSAGASPRMVYAGLLLNVDIWTVPLDANRGIPSGDVARLTQGVAFDAFPSLSRDGARLAYASRLAGTWALRQRELRTGREWTIANFREGGPEPRISGDGQRVAYSDQNYALFRIRSEGGAAEKLCDVCGPPTDVSYDGTRVLFEPVEPPDDVMLLEGSGGQKHNLVRAGKHPELYGGRFSPDGRWVAFHASTRGAGTLTVYVAPIAGGQTPPASEWVQVTDGDFAEGDVAWSPDGQMLYYLSDRDGSRCVWARKLEAATKKPQGSPLCVQHFHHARQSLRRLGNRGGAIGLSVAPGRLVLALGELTGNLWLREVKQTSGSWSHRVRMLLGDLPESR